MNVASNRPHPQIVHRSAAWWQEVQKNGEAVQPVFNSDGTVTGIDLAKAIADPNSGQQLGAVKGRIPIHYLDRASYTLPLAKLSSSLRVQILAPTENDLMKPIRTLTSDGLKDTSEVLGGTPIAQKAIELVQQLQVQNPPEEPTIQSFDYGNGDWGLLTASMQGNQRYLLATIPGSSWVVVGATTQKELASQG
ncbi:hypothetical protein [Leptodesmis sp.]|uniref:hypothetical protein n=1 Tax=Leptodesmis sp. TaxID=3100501 RepID=UPI00405348BB